MKIKGKAYWAKVRTPEEWQGNPVGFSVQVEMPPENLQKMKDYFTQKIKEEVFPDKKFVGEITLPIKDNNGTDTVKVRTKHYYVDKATGQQVPKHIPVYNEYGELIPEDVLIGNGSDVEVACNAKYYYEGQKKWGVRLYLNSMMVVNLVKYSTDGSDEFDFKQRGEADEEAESNTTNDDEVDF